MAETRTDTPPETVAASTPGAAPGAPGAPREAITDLLRAWNAGDSRAADRLVPLVYDELRAIAGGYFKNERQHHTLQATAVVHEAYVRLVESPGLEWQSRAHFVGVVARVMRRVLVDHARRHHAAKRGGGDEKVTLSEAAELGAEASPDVRELDRALAELEAVDPDKARIVELRFFGGLSIAETADHLGVSAATVNRQWRRARNWLYRRLKQADSPVGGNDFSTGC